MDSRAVAGAGLLGACLFSCAAVSPTEVATDEGAPGQIIQATTECVAKRVSSVCRQSQDLTSLISDPECKKTAASDACMQAGDWLYDRPEARRASWKAALETYTRACDFGNLRACRYIENMREGRHKDWVPSIIMMNMTGTASVTDQPRR